MLIDDNQQHMGANLYPRIYRIPITKARVNLGQLVRRVHLDNEYFILEKDGIPVAGILSADELEDYLELQDPRLRKQIEEGYEEHRRGKARSFDAFLATLRRKRARGKTKGGRLAAGVRSGGRR